MQTRKATRRSTLRTPVRTHLSDLGDVHDALRARQREAALQQAQEQAQRQASESARWLFRDAVGAVTPLRQSGRAEVEQWRPQPWPHQREADERAALRQTWSDEVDLESLLLTDDGLSFRRPGIAADVVTRLRRGQWAIQGELDLHGLRRNEARQVLQGFLGDAGRRGQRCVRIVHGKGHGSPGRHPVLKLRVQRWLAQSAEVIAFAQASGPQGGAGALIALLARGNRSLR